MATITTNSAVEFNNETMRVVGHQGFDDVVLKSKIGRLFTVPVVELLDEAKRSPKPAQKIDPIRQAKVAAYKNALAPVIDAKSRTSKAGRGSRAR